MYAAMLMCGRKRYQWRPRALRGLSARRRRGTAGRCKDLASATLVAFVWLNLLASPCSAQELPHPDAEKLGQVHFATSCTGMAQAEFNRAVALLHSFQFSRAIDGFNAVLADDPTCAIAYWGVALSRWTNPFAPGKKDSGQLQLGRASVDRGRELGAKTERERAYLTAVGRLFVDFEKTPQQARLLAYRDAMRDVAAAYPGDHEARIFYALALAAAEDPADKSYRARLEAGAILERLFEEEPTHPGIAHYIIHAYDVPALAGHALAATRRYAEIAPDAPHALHMPSHTFTRLGYWNDSIESNAAAATAARREGQGDEELHASDYEVYAYLQSGRDRAAGRIVKSLPEIASRFDPQAALTGAGGPSVGYFALAAIPARYALERRDWTEAGQLVPLETPYPHTEAMTWFARGIGAARLGQAAAANESALALQRIQDRLLQAGEMYWARQVEIQTLAVAAWTDFAAGKKAAAVRQMASAAALEDATEKSVVTPGPLAPARELLAEMLLESNEPAQALEQFKVTLEKEPRRFRSLYGAARAAQLSGHRTASRTYFRELLAVCADADQPGRPELEEARAALTKRHD